MPLRLEVSHRAGTSSQKTAIKVTSVTSGSDRVRVVRE
jgi:hypothetical protein